MNIRTPQPAHAARLLQSYFKTQGIVVKYNQALEAVARMNGYQDLHAMQADIRFADPMAVTAVSSNELELRDKEHSVWIGVDNISVCVTRNDEGVSVDLYAKGHEDDSLTGTHLFFEEARDAASEGDEDEEDGKQTGTPADVQADPHVLDGPGIWGVRGDPADFPCNEIELAPPQPCVLFAPLPVDWSRVADAQFTHLRLDRDPVRELSLVKQESLITLAIRRDLSSHVNLARSVVFAYPVAEDLNSPRFISLGALQKAVEYAPGVIDLIDGRKLELLVQGKDGQMKRYSPALNGLVNVD